MDREKKTQQPFLLAAKQQINVPREQISKAEPVPEPKPAGEISTDRTGQSNHGAIVAGHVPSGRPGHVWARPTICIQATFPLTNGRQRGRKRTQTRRKSLYREPLPPAAAGWHNQGPGPTGPVVPGSDRSRCRRATRVRRTVKGIVADDVNGSSLHTVCAAMVCRPVSQSLVE